MRNVVGAIANDLPLEKAADIAVSFPGTIPFFWKHFNSPSAEDTTPLHCAEQQKPQDNLPDQNEQQVDAFSATFTELLMGDSELENVFGTTSLPASPSSTSRVTPSSSKSAPQLSHVVPDSAPPTPLQPSDASFNANIAGYEKACENDTFDVENHEGDDACHVCEVLNPEMKFKVTHNEISLICCQACFSNCKIAAAKNRSGVHGILVVDDHLGKRKALVQVDRGSTLKAHKFFGSQNWTNLRVLSCCKTRWISAKDWLSETEQ